MNPHHRRRVVAFLALLAPLAALTAVPSAPAHAVESAARDDASAWSVTPAPGGGWEVAWASPTRLPLGADRPTIVATTDGFSIGAPTVDDDGRTVRAVVAGETGDAGAVAPDPADLDVVLSGDRLDEPGRDGAPSVTSARRVAAPERAVLDAPDPGATGPFGVVASDYELDPVKLPRMAEPIEMIGHVVEPALDAATGPRPLVLFLHGRHEVCYRPDGKDGFTDAWPCPAPFAEIPSQLGYDYLQRVLASQGYATVSVRVNGINAQDFRLDDGGADARAAIVRRHLDHWTTIAAAHRVDLDRVVLVGHSRGGEGVDRASIQIPLDAPYRIAGQVLLAPTDFASHTAPYVPTVTVLPYCDGDVSDLQGQRFTDVARDLAPGRAVGADTSLKSSVLVLGANHNFFNTEWTPGIAQAPAGDDWFGAPRALCGTKNPGRLSAAEQRDVGTAYVAGAVHLFTDPSGDGAAYLPLFDGSAVTVPSVGDAVVYFHALGGGRDARRPGFEATPTLARGAETSLCQGRSSFGDGSLSSCGADLGDRVAPHWTSDGDRSPARSFLAMSWTASGASGGLAFRGAPLDLSTDRLELRTIVDPRGGPVAIRVRLTDAAGGTAVLTPEGGSSLAPLPVAAGVTKLWAQAVLVDAADAAGLDPTRVVSVEILGDSARGRLYVADLAAAPPALADVPDTRLPQVDVGTLRVEEGDRGRRVARVPFTVTGDVTEPARFAVDVVGLTQGGGRDRFVVDVAPGQTSGSVPVAYSADRLYAGLPVAITELTAWPLRGIATDDYRGGLRVVEDDPTPVVRVRPLARTVAEGGVAVFRVSISTPYAVRYGGNATVVPGSGRGVRGTDVPLAWLKRHGDASRPGRLLSQLSTYDYLQFSPGQRFIDVGIPIARDDVREPVETLALRFQLGRERVRAQVRVADAPR